MSFIETARKLRKIMESAVQSLTDETALEAICLYPGWEKGLVCGAGSKVRRGSKLYRCIQSHTAMEGWEPENSPALWEEINETHAGTREDPIPYGGNMALRAGRYYTQEKMVYLCIRDTVIPVYSPLAELVGMYLEAAA